MSFKEFSKDIKSGIIGSNIFLYGEEGFLTDWAVKTIIENNSSEAERKYVVTDLDGESVSAQEIVETANTMTMFASTRVLTVKNYPPLIKKSAVTETAPILEYLSNPNSSTILIFYIEPLHSPGKKEKLNAFATKVAAACSTYNFDRLNPAELKSFVNKRIRAAGKLIGARDMDYLVDISGYLNNDSEYDLYRMESDLTKLVNASDDTTISKQLIEDIMIGDKDRFVFNFIDYLLAGKKAKKVLLDYLGEQELPQDSSLCNLLLDQSIPALVANVSSKKIPAYLVMVPPVHTVILFRSLLSFEVVHPLGRKQLLEALKMYLPWFSELVSHTKVVIAKDKLEGWGLLRDSYDFIGARGELL